MSHTHGRKGIHACAKCSIYWRENAAQYLIVYEWACPHDNLFGTAYESGGTNDVYCLEGKKASLMHGSIVFSGRAQSPCSISGIKARPPITT